MGVNIDVTGPVALDTAAFIYYIEEHQSFLPLLAPLFEAADAGRAQIVTSAVSLLEVLVIPYRKGNRKVATRYEELMTRSRGVRMIDVDHSQLRAAAYLRASHRIRTVDAIQVAAALSSGCTTFLTNDLRLPKIAGLTIVQLSDLI